MGNESKKIKFFKKWGLNNELSEGKLEAYGWDRFYLTLGVIHNFREGRYRQGWHYSADLICSRICLTKGMEIFQRWGLFFLLSLNN